MEGKFAVAAVDEHQKLDGARAAQLHHLGDGGAHRAAGVEHVVADEHVFAVDAEADLAAQKGDVGIFTQIVAVEGDIELAHGHGRAFDLLQKGAHALRHHHAARLDADKGEVGGAVVAFDDLMRQAAEGVFHAGGIHQLTFQFHGCSSCGGASRFSNKSSTRVKCGGSGASKHMRSPVRGWVSERRQACSSCPSRLNFCFLLP